MLALLGEEDARFLKCVYGLEIADAWSVRSLNVGTAYTGRAGMRSEIAHEAEQSVRIHSQARDGNASRHLAKIVDWIDIPAGLAVSLMPEYRPIDDPLRDLRSIASDTITALDELHAMQLCHGNIEPASIMELLDCSQKKAFVLCDWRCCVSFGVFLGESSLWDLGLPPIASSAYDYACLAAVVAFWIGGQIPESCIECAKILETAGEHRLSRRLLAGNALGATLVQANDGVAP